MDAANWIVIGLICAAIVAAFAAFGFGLWRKINNVLQGGETNGKLLDIVDLVLRSIADETTKAVRDLPQAEIEAAARAVYDKLIAGTPFEAIVTQPGFVEIVVGRWRAIAEVEVVAQVGVMAVREKMAAGLARK